MKCIRRLGMSSHALIACVFLFVFRAQGAEVTWTGSGLDGNWGTPGNWSTESVPTGTDIAVFDSASGSALAIAVSENRTIQQIHVRGTDDVVLTIASPATLTVSNNGVQGLTAYTANLTVNGPGLLACSAASATDFLNNGAAPGLTLTIGATIVALNGSTDTGFESWIADGGAGGTIVLDNENNTFTRDVAAGNGHIFIVSKLANSGQSSTLGAGTWFRAGRGSVLRYTGPATSTDRQFHANGGDAILGYGGGIEHAGTGALTWAGPVYNSNNSVQTLHLSGDTAHEARITGPIYNATGTLGINKHGSGTWVLAGSNTFTGPIAVNAGTLALDSTNAAGNASQITLADGTTLTVNPSAADGFTLSVPPIAASGSSVTLTIAPAPTASTVTLAGLTAVSAAITAPNAGTPKNRILIAGLVAGDVGPWLTVNGLPAHYDTATGLAPKTTAFIDVPLATKSSTLPNNAATRATITTVGNGGDIQLPADTTTLYSLTQAAAGPATVATAGKTLLATEVAIAPDADTLTIGAQPQDGRLLPPLELNVGGGVPVIPDNAAIAALDPIIWYDPSEIATATFAGNTVTRLTNKGRLGATHDAVVRSSWNAPIYATDGDSHSALPMLKSSVNNQALQSAANTGISGTAARTLVSVMSRDSGMASMVSMGMNTSGRAFENYLATAAVRFGTFSGDIDMPGGAPAINTPIVMVFQNGVIVDDVADPFTSQGFANGAASATQRRTDLNTTDSPLVLQGRAGGTATNYRGQIGEVMLFDYTLDAAQRATVEAYLMAKWQQTVLPAAEQSATLSLRNDSPAAPLTVNAAIEGPVGSTVSLVKSGEGDVILAGGVTLKGAIAIGAGTLTVDTPGGVTDTFSGTLLGAGALAKQGLGTLSLASSAANQYLGGTDVYGGILTVGNSRSLGADALTVHNGGTLDIGGGAANESITLNNPVTVSGAGADGLGAIVNNGFVSQRNAFQNTTITLGAPATFGGSSPLRWDIAGMGATLDLNTFTLTKTGVSDFRISPANVINAPAGTAFDIQEGTLGIESQTVLAPNTADRQIAIGAGGRLGIYNMTEPINWTVMPADGAEIWSYGSGDATNANVFTSGLLLPGTLHLTASGGHGKNLAGQLTGAGGISVHDGGMSAMSLLSHPNNTFTGPAAVSNAVLGLRYPGSLLSFAQLSLAQNSSAVRVFMGGDGWTGAQVKQLAESGCFNAAAADTQRLQIDVGADDTASLPAIEGTFAGNLEKFGPGTLTLDNDITLLNGHARSYAGALILTNNATFDAGYGSLYLGATAANVIGGDAVYTSADLGYNIPGGPAILVATPSAKAVLDVTGSAQIQANIFIGGTNTTDTAAVGAVYQSGDSEWLCTGGAANNARIGIYGYGYYQLDGGQLTAKGYLDFGRMTGSSIGILRQTDGAFLCNGGLATPGNGNPGPAYGGFINLSRGGVGILQLEGGTFMHYGEMRVLYESDNSGNDGTAIVTVTGTADATFDRQITIGNRNNGLAMLNLNGGTLTTTYILRKNRASATVAVNFNGGTLSVTNNAGSTALLVRENDQPMSANVYPGGAILDLGTGVTRTLDIPLQRPAGAGIGSIPVNAGGTGYIAPPYVRITGGGGTGASAFAHINRQTGAVTHIEITNPGWGYTSLPTVALTGGGGSGTTFGLIRLASHGEGGFTKTGDGTLILSAANTYEGTTRVNRGTLTLAHPQAIPPSSPVIIGDGIIDLGGHTISNASITITGTGGIINGKVITASAVKTGPGTAIWDASIEFADVATETIPGLWEGHVKGANGNNWGFAIPNPKTSVQLTTRAGNVPNGSNSTAPRSTFWSNGYNMWIYTGYLWNREPTNVTWTFRFQFDDYVSLMIDNTLLRNHNGGTATYTTYTLTPGPHPIEIRYGDNTGNVGAAAGAGGLTYDPTASGSTEAGDYFALEDDGTGRLLTATLGEIAAQDHALRVEDGTLLIPAPEPGLWEGGPLSGNPNTATANPRDAITLTTVAANGFCSTGVENINGKYWPNNHTWVYTGYIWNRSPTNETWTFVEHFDDRVRLTIDGISVLNNDSSSVLSMNNHTLTPGPHLLEVRFGQGTGGVGASGTASWFANSQTISLAVDYLGRDEEIFANYQMLADPGDGSRLTLTTIGAGAGVLDGTTIDVAPGATLDLGGIPRDGLTITGGGSVINGVTGDGFTLSPAGDDHTGTMSVDGFTSLAGMTYLVTVHEPPIPAPSAPVAGLWEGMIRAAWDTTTPNPSNTVKLTTEAGNLPKGTNSTDPRAPFWNGNNHTWVYTGYLWNRAPTNVTWTWRFTFDDNVSLMIDGKYVARTPNVIYYANHTLTPGPHAIEIRYGDGSGSVGPESGLGGVTYDPLGRGHTSALENFIPLADPGDGSLLTLTKGTPFDSGTHDAITSIGALDLTGLTIVPSDAASISPSGSKYVIATASSFTGTPKLEGFEGKAWKTLRQGTELWLTTQGGTLIILK